MCVGWVEGECVTRLSHSTQVVMVTLSLQCMPPSRLIDLLRSEIQPWQEQFRNKSMYTIVTVKWRKLSRQLFLSKLCYNSVEAETISLPLSEGPMGSALFQDNLSYDNED